VRAVGPVLDGVVARVALAERVVGVGGALVVSAPVLVVGVGASGGVGGVGGWFGGWAALLIVFVALGVSAWRRLLLASVVWRPAPFVSLLERPG
jgi:hypothetical protein